MSEVSIKIRFESHVCTNHTCGDFRSAGECEECESCRCDRECYPGYCCDEDRSTSYCSDCGCEVEFPYCYPCNGESCCEGETIEEGADVTFTGLVVATWKHGTLVSYNGSGHPHLNGSYCLGGAADLFVDVTTVEQAVEAVVTHISNVDFNDGLGGPYTGIEVA